jgi:hypothetical protein
VRGDSDQGVDGAMVVRAVVHARLLGLRLLTLDARVVVAPAEAGPTSLDLMAPVAVDDLTAPKDQVVGAATPASRALAGRPPPQPADGGVSRARELLAQGTHTLARTARPA